MDFIRKHYKVILFSIPAISLLLHLHVFGLDLVGIHVWRQTETQTVINNFYSESLNIFNPHVNDHADTARLHRMEFPLMQWIYAVFYKLFGPHIIISRILTFITGLFSVYGMYHFCKLTLRSTTLAAICAWCFNFSPVFYYYTMNPLPDNMALCFAIWSLTMFCRYIDEKRTSLIVWSAVLLSLATLVKLPYIIYGSFIAAYLVWQLKRGEISVNKFTLVTGTFAICIAPATCWYAWVIPTWKNGVLAGMAGATESSTELLMILGGTVASVLPELLVNYGSVLLFAAGMFFLIRRKAYRNDRFPIYAIWGIAIVVYYLFEMNMINTVHDYYLYPFLPPLFLITAYGAGQLLASKKPATRALTVVCLCVLPVTAFLRIDSRWDLKDPGFNPVYYAFKQELRALTAPGDLVVAGNDDSHYILLYYLDRKGWAFDHDMLDEQQLSYYISKGAKFLFLDNKKDEQPEIKAHLSAKVFEKGTLRVYSLK